MERYKKLALFGGILGILIDLIVVGMREEVEELAILAIILNLIAIIVSFTISNTKAVGVVLLIVSVITLLITGPAGIVGFALFLPGGILALRHKNEEEEEKKKRRKALAVILDILDKINTINEWNEHLHELHQALKRYEYVLPRDIRQRIDEIDRLTDTSPDRWNYMLEDLKRQLNNVYDEHPLPSLAFTSDKTSKGLIAKIIIGVLAITIPGGAVAYYYAHSTSSSDSTIPSEGDKDGNNKSPIADAGPNQKITCTSVVCETVTLDGSQSSDPDGDSLDYNWESTGRSVQIENADTDNASFTPHCSSSHDSVTYEFKLTVDDGNDRKDSDTTNVKVVCTQVG